MRSKITGKYFAILASDTQSLRDKVVWQNNSEEAQGVSSAWGRADPRALVLQGPSWPQWLTRSSYLTEMMRKPTANGRERLQFPGNGWMVKPSVIDVTAIRMVSISASANRGPVKY